jgi:hypothetical protein
MRWAHRAPSPCVARHVDPAETPTSCSATADREAMDERAVLGHGELHRPATEDVHGGQHGDRIPGYLHGLEVKRYRHDALQRAVPVQDVACGNVPAVRADLGDRRALPGFEVVKHERLGHIEEKAAASRQHEGTVPVLGKRPRRAAGRADDARPIRSAVDDLLRREPVRTIALFRDGQDRPSPKKPLGAHGGGELGPQDLDGHAAVVPQVVGKIHGGHAARAELALEAVAVREGGRQAMQVGRHRTAPCSAGVPL